MAPLFREFDKFGLKIFVLVFLEVHEYQITLTALDLDLIKFIVVSIGTNPTFKVKKVPMEYVPTMPKRLHFFRSTFSLFNYTSSIF